MTATLPILMYHSVDRHCAPAYRRWTVSPDRFAAQMGAIRDRGYTPVGISDLARMLQAGRSPERAVAITFDDGLADFGRHALPILERFGFASTLFVTTGYVGETSRWLADLGEGERPMLTWDELRQLPGRNVEVGAHTHTHRQLDLLPPGEVRQEIELSKTLLEAQIGRPVSSFAYPHGYSTPEVRRLVAEAGFAVACRVADGLMQPGESLLALPRVIITEDWSSRRIEALLDGKCGIAPAPDRPAMKAWRLYRRARSILHAGAGAPGSLAAN